MMKDNDLQIIGPMLIEKKCPSSEVRKHCRILAGELIKQIIPELDGHPRVLFSFVLRGAMLLYIPFAEEFDEASFCFISSGSVTELDCLDYDTAVIVDTVIETGKTVFDVKKLMESTGINAKNWFVAAVCANKSVSRRLSEGFDRVFCLSYMDNVRVTIDAGKYATCGDGVLIL